MFPCKICVEIGIWLNYMVSWNTLILQNYWTFTYSFQFQQKKEQINLCWNLRCYIYIAKIVTMCAFLVCKKIRTCKSFDIFHVCNRNGYIYWYVHQIKCIATFCHIWINFVAGPGPSPEEAAKIFSGRLDGPKITKVSKNWIHK